MAIHKLSVRKVETASPGKYEDGGGLRLVVSAAGAKKWVFRYTLNGKRREMGLGSFSEVGLGKARDKAKEARELLYAHKDPIECRLTEPNAVPAFTACAAGFIRAQRRGWSNRKHARQWVSTLKTYARPVMGKKPVDTVTTADVLKALTPIWTAKPETAKRVQGRIENVLDFASAHKYRDPINPARWRGHLDKLLPRPSRVKAVTHHPAMPHTEIASFMGELETSDGVSALALRFVILTATRTGEALKAQWPEIDLERKTWTIPTRRMKARREHRVPLSAAALAILRAVPKVNGNNYIFPGGCYGKSLSGMALLQLMRGMGYGVNGAKGNYVPHGFRSSFRDWAGEVSSFPRDVCEMALAHVVPDKVEAAYRRGDLFQKRIKMMDAWAAYATHARAGYPASPSKRSAIADSGRHGVR